jgi:hypothetical protein
MMSAHMTEPRCLIEARDMRASFQDGFVSSGKRLRRRTKMVSGERLHRPSAPHERAFMTGGHGRRILRLNPARYPHRRQPESESPAWGAGLLKEAAIGGIIGFSYWMLKTARGFTQQRRPSGI